MFSDTPRFHFTLLDPKFFESLDTYRPEPELVDIATALTQGAWAIRPRGFWCRCTPTEDTRFIQQGWKIHLSANVRTAADVLTRIVPVALAHGTSFKFASDLRMVQLSTGKNWPRTGAGKFITLYPESEAIFVALIEACHQATLGLEGPYLLTDRPYRGSGVVFYRYGEHAGIGGVDAHGLRPRAIVSPDGSVVSDERVPYFRLPSWVADPFAPPNAQDAAAAPKRGESVLLAGRYRINGAQRYSAFGGLYHAIDERTGQQVFVREARPHLGFPEEGADSRGLLRKEARILAALAPTNLAPQLVDCFEHANHLFLVQERLEAESLWAYFIEQIFGEHPASPGELWQRLAHIIREMADGLDAVHDRGIVIRDFTKSNVLISKDGHVKFIDFEFAYELNGNLPAVRGWTPGYASPEQRRTVTPSPHEDYYALGALILDVIAFTASGLTLNREGVMRWFDRALEILRLPQELARMVEGLIEPDISRRWSTRQVRETLARMAANYETPVHRAAPRIPGDLDQRMRAVVDGVASYCLASADYSRVDRLWPASGEIFPTNPVSYEFGAAGTLDFLRRAGAAIPTEVNEWFLQRVSTALYPPGLFIGAGGVALVLADLGRVPEARDALARVEPQLQALDSAGLYQGLAGWGLAQIGMWRRTAIRSHLDAARLAAARIANMAFEDERGAYWRENGRIPLGLAFGGSGVAVFLTHLIEETGECEYLPLAERAFAFDWSYGQWVNGTAIWFTHVDAHPGSPQSPHMRHGSCGVGTAAIRLYAMTGDARYHEYARVCLSTIERGFTNKIWQDYGLAGFGEFAIDVYQATGDPSCLELARHFADLILLHRLETPEGVTFLGSEMLRISCDFGMGAAGIASFFLRVLTPDAERPLFNDRSGLSRRIMHQEALSA